MLSRPQEGGGSLSGFLGLMMLPATGNSQVLVRAWQLMTRDRKVWAQTAGEGACVGLKYNARPSFPGVIVFCLLRGS